MTPLKTDLSGLIHIFPQLSDRKNVWPVILKEEAEYYILVRNDTPVCFCGVVRKDNRHASIEGLWADKTHKSPTAVFELMDYVSFILMDYDVKIYVINDIALWGWKRLGFKVIKQKKMKYWTAYWMERNAIWHDQE